VRTITVTNTDGGAGGGHAMFVNAIEATAVPEPGVLTSCAVAGAALLLRRVR
jgi:hypothetical protein